MAVIARDQVGYPCGWLCKRLSPISYLLTVEALLCPKTLPLVVTRGFDKRFVQLETSRLALQIQDLSFTFGKRHCNEAQGSCTNLTR